MFKVKLKTFYLYRSNLILNMTPRHKISALLAQLFSKSYSEMRKSYELNQQIELTEHLSQQIKIIKEYQKTQSENIFY